MLRKIWLWETRIAARITPRARPMTIAAAVSAMVMARPDRIGFENRYSKTTFQSKRSLVTNECPTVAMRRAITAIPTHLQGCLNGVIGRSCRWAGFAMLVSFLLRDGCGYRMLT